MDIRERENGWYESFDEGRMEVSVYNDAEFTGGPYKVRWEVCETCQGRGHHVNPSIDSHGISPEEFDEDEDFRRDYLAGRYDMPCNECQGRRVVLMPVDPEGIAWMREWYAGEREMRAIYDAERRMGA